MAPIGSSGVKSKDSKFAEKGHRSKTEKGKKKATTAKDIFKAASETDFSDQSGISSFETKYKAKWEKRPGNSILCFVARNTGWPEGVAWDDNKTRQFLNWILKNHHGLLAIKDEDLQPLHLALWHNHNAFVNAILDFPKLMNISQVLSDQSIRGNALHIAVTKNMDLLSFQSLVRKCDQFTDIFSCQHGVDRNTPLHACMSVDLDDADNIHDESGSELDDGDDSEGSVTSEDQSTEPSDEEDEHGHASVTSSRPEGFGLKHTQSYRVSLISQRTTELVSVVQTLVEHKDSISVLQLLNASGRTPYQERLHHLEKAQKDESEDPVASYIRSYCVKNFPRDVVMKCLYHTGQEKHIEFDLGGLGRDIISLEYLEQLSKHLQFESILKYVALPKLALEVSPRERLKSKKWANMRGRSDVVPVFEWLRKHHVKKIVKVIVLDDQDPCHADTSIEKALKGFDVEVWDWKRLDLSTEAIHRSTKVVKEVSLYSTGNNAVLMGWASSKGLPNREYFPKLRTVKLYIREGYEPRDRLDEYIEDFKNTVQRDSDDQIEVAWKIDNTDISHASEFQSGAEHLQYEHQWIEYMAKFSGLLQDHLNDNEGLSKARPVKIAIIDDGVDASLSILDGKIAVGKSFCPYANSGQSSELMSPYFVSSSNHGTCMATLICRLCPMVRLYVARLDQRQIPGSNQRHITAKSAAEAIRWATDCGVDIISMSWTIETPVPGNADMKSLEDAVQAAKIAEIVMFCSTSDQGSLTKDYCYPGNFPGCITIGSASNTGDPMAWVNVEKVDFLLPGSNVTFKSNEGKPVRHESGSSVATAAASGLAGFLMFSSWFLNDSDTHLKNYENMKAALKSLTSVNKYPRAHERLEQRYKDVMTRGELGNSKKTYSLPKMWTDNCKDALAEFISRIKEVN